MRILCFGDSNTYGYHPRGFFGDRYGPEDRWVDLLESRPVTNVSMPVPMAGRSHAILMLSDCSPNTRLWIFSL